MSMSLYVSAISAGSCTEKFSVISNNLANVDNTGFKPKSAIFLEPTNYNLNDSSEAVTELRAEAGIRVRRTSTSFDVSGLTQTGSQYNYAIARVNTFFMIQDPETGERASTRSDHFRRGKWDEGLYLMMKSDGLVLDQNQKPIKLDVLDTEKTHEETESGYELEDENKNENEDKDKPKISLYTFTNPSRLASAGDNKLSADNIGVEPVLVERPSPAEGALETSRASVAREWTRLIKCQRTSSCALRMVTVSNKVEDTINTLRDWWVGQKEGQDGNQTL